MTSSSGTTTRGSCATTATPTRRTRTGTPTPRGARRFSLAVYYNPFYFYPSYWYPTRYYGGTNVGVRAAGLAAAGSTSSRRGATRLPRTSSTATGAARPAMQQPADRGVRGADFGGVGTRCPRRAAAGPWAVASIRRRAAGGWWAAPEPVVGGAPLRRQPGAGLPQETGRRSAVPEPVTNPRVVGPSVDDAVARGRRSDAAAAARRVHRSRQAAGQQSGAGRHRPPGAARQPALHRSGDAPDERAAAGRGRPPGAARVPALHPAVGTQAGVAGHAGLRSAGGGAQRAVRRSARGAATGLRASQRRPQLFTARRAGGATRRSGTPIRARPGATAWVTGGGAALAPHRAKLPDAPGRTLRPGALA